MQLYVSDYLGDTQHLSCEQHGAYLLLLMTMWNARGSLPNNDSKLARIARVSLKKWRGMKDDILSFFEVSGDILTHSRVEKELQKSDRKSELRASAGAQGGRAKALKNNKPTLANAVAKPKHSPDTREKEDTNVSSKKAARLPDDWKLPDEWRGDATALGLPPNLIDLEAARMRDWSRSAPGGAKLDWRASWRNWCRTAAERVTAKGQPPPRRDTPALAARRMLNEIENGTGTQSPTLENPDAAAQPVRQLQWRGGG